MRNTTTLHGRGLLLFLQSRFNMSREKAIDFMKKHNQDLSFLTDEEEVSQKKPDQTRGVKMTPPADFTEGLRTFDKYKQNLKADNNNIFSYDTKVADIDHVKREITPLGWWSVTTSKHINYVASEYGYKVQKTN